MKNTNNFKLAVIAAFTAVNSFFGLLAIPIYVMVLANVIDYITGIMASHYRGEETKSNIGIRGIAKKIGLWILVAIGYGMDVLINFAAVNMGISMQLKCLVSIAVVMWIICNEFISIIENLGDIGTKTPEFLLKLVKLLKGKTEETMDIESEVK